MTSAAPPRQCGTCGSDSVAESRFCSMCGASLAAGAHGSDIRRHVVILFADLEGFTSLSEGLDPEVLRAVMDRYFRLCSQLIWNYGGTTEKFIGDAVMAVFGIPLSREDDALRAVRSAVGIVTELQELNRELISEYGIDLSVRIGVFSGPVSASYDLGGDFRIVGDTVNTASRLQSSARPNEVLVGESVAQVVRARMALEEVDPLRVKGKEAPLRAWRVLSDGPSEEAVAVRSAPLIGRDAELQQLRHTYDSALLRGRGCMVTLLGPPGIGKSRLAAEFQESVADTPGGGPTVLLGHVHSYGKGMTYRPIAEMLESAKGAWAAFQVKGDKDPVARQAAEYLQGISRRDDGLAHGAEVEDISWALRVFLGSIADRGPLVLVWEDLHWAEPTLLDVIEYLSEELGDLPVMHICLARSELLELRPSWSGGRPGAVTLELLPLSEDETRYLVSELARGGSEVEAQDLDDICERVAVACEGNPLFAELMLDVVGEDPSNPTPATIQAVLAARLDRLDPDERLLLEMAAVAGREFAVGEVEVLLQGDARADVDLARLLAQLRRSRLVQGSAAARRLRFAQALGRDTAYELTAKRHRLRWHLALADTIEQRRRAEPAGSAGEPDNLTYHLESAWSLARELSPHGRSSTEIAHRAAAALTAEAMQAMDRKDLPAAVSLLERAHAILPADAPGQPQLVLRLSDTWVTLRRREDALAVIDGVGGGPAAVPAWLEIQRQLVELRFGTRTPEDILGVEQAIEAGLPEDDQLAWCRFHQLRAHRFLMQERIGPAERSLQAAAVRARALGDRYEEDRVRRVAGELALWGPTPVAEGLVLCRELGALFAESRVSLVPILAATAGLLSLDGQFAESAELLATASAYTAELRLDSADVGVAHISGFAAASAGDHQAAHGHFEHARELLAAAGQQGGATLLAAYAARELVASGGPLPDAYRGMSEAELAALTDPRTGVLVRLLCARAAVEAAEPEPALALMDQATALAARMDDSYFQGTAQEDIAELLELLGLGERACAAAARAAERYRAKGARVAQQRMHRTAARLGCPQPAQPAATPATAEEQ
ncbi:adenylate/guanylate cyclase domain-containing protein [Streptacidiphilus sp. N1-12]|uniref:Adenylate/guanylate cyclase domain-containing protein n=2 Tax=Streptacidiphilus alkalitolerans TaxID=3342712 RepID=A0ABV6WGD4_9ACTN